MTLCACVRDVVLVEVVVEHLVHLLEVGHLVVHALVAGRAHLHEVAEHDRALLEHVLEAPVEIEVAREQLDGQLLSPQLVVVVD